METYGHPTLLQGTDRQASFADLISEIEDRCKKCMSMTPITCLAGCRTWKLKNQFRNLYKTARNPDFMTRLTNTLKNKTRLRLLEIVTKERYSIARLQQELKTQGFSHSQQTIVEDYVTPLIEVGLLQDDQKAYSATVFGCRLSELANGFIDLGDLLSPHSECYEEIALDSLSTGPKTHEELGKAAPANSLARILSRLQERKLVEKSQETEHIFFFITRRDPSIERLSSTERRVYDNISIDGISARKLAQKTSISLRRTYRYIRRLKGKKLVFAREKSTLYWLTTKGKQVTMLLQGMRNLTAEALKTTIFLAEEKGINGRLVHDPYSIDMKSKSEEMVPSKIARHLKDN
jgi:predicted transcriptional regulator